MASIIYCDRVRHIVQESRTTIEELVEADVHKFIYLTPEGTETQVALRAKAITSFQAMPGDGI